MANREETYTHYHAQVNRPGEVFPERSTLTDKVVLDFANWGTTPDQVTPALRERADRIWEALRAGHCVQVGLADIVAITEADFRAGRVRRTTTYVRIGRD